MPFLETSVYARWVDAITWMWISAPSPFADLFTRSMLYVFAPHIKESFWQELEKASQIAFAAVAEAIEQKAPEKLDSVMEPKLYSLFMENYELFTRVNHYRLRVHGIQSRRLFLNTRWKFPAFSGEMPLSVQLSSSTEMHYTTPSPPEAKSIKDLVYTRRWMTETLGTNYGLWRQAKSKAETPTQDGQVLTDPVASRLKSNKELKQRIRDYFSVPFPGDLQSLWSYLQAMRRFGFEYVIRNARIELDVTFGYDCLHDLSVVPIYENAPEDIKESEQNKEDRKAKEQKDKEEVDRKLKYPEYVDQRAPHIVTFTCSVPIHRDGAPPTPWMITEFDGMIQGEKKVISKLAKLSAQSVDEIDQTFPSLRIFSRDLFTPAGPKPEWFAERERMKKLNRQLASTGSLDLEPKDDPTHRPTVSPKSIIGQLEQHARNREQQQLQEQTKKLQDHQLESASSGITVKRPKSFSPPYPQSQNKNASPPL